MWLCFKATKRVKRMYSKTALLIIAPAMYVLEFIPLLFLSVLIAVPNGWLTVLLLLLPLVLNIVVVKITSINR
jgi:hypothetical protein